MSEKIDWAEVFEELDPPPGGLARLRSRLDQTGRSRWFGRPGLRWATAAACSILVVIVLYSTAIRAQYKRRANEAVWVAGIMDSGNPALIRLGLNAPDQSAVTIDKADEERIAIEKVAVSAPGVMYYRIAVLPES